METQGKVSPRGVQYRPPVFLPVVIEPTEGVLCLCRCSMCNTEGKSKYKLTTLDFSFPSLLDILGQGAGRHEPIPVGCRFPKVCHKFPNTWS